MPEVTRVVRSYRDGYASDDDDRSSMISHSRVGDGSYRTVQRYRVTPSRNEEVEIDRRSSTRLDVVPRSERIEIDRRSERFVEPERPRSAIDMRPRSTIVERYVDREPLREPERERTRTVVYERDRHEPERSPWNRGPARPWESERDVRETDVRIEKRTTERREEPYELERYQRETEYYDRPEPLPQPIIIRQRAPEPQQIIVQEAPAPPPIVLPPREEQVQVVRQEVTKEVVRQPEPEPRRTEDEYYYRKDVRQVGHGRRSDEDFAIAEYDRRDIRPRDSVSDRSYSDGEDYVVRKKIIRRERSRSGSPHHKRHLAEGALAGAGAAALLSNHRRKSGDGGGHSGRNVVGGAALGAIGAEVITRARSRYRENHDSRSRSRSSSRHSHHKIKTALGLAAAGLAAAAAAKYVSNRKQNKEELGRGRSRTRSVSRRRGSSYDYDSYDDERPRSRSRSKHADPKHRAATIAKAGAATAAVAGVVEHFRNKSRKRSGSRSKSRIRTGAEIAGAGLAGAAVAGLYENRKAKEDREAEIEEDRRERRRSRSRARSIGAYSDPGVDPELGMVQYGTEPVYTHQQTTTYQRGYDPAYDPALAAGAAGATYGATRSRSRHRRHSSSSGSPNNSRSRSRSRSRIRNIAGVAAGTAAAAVGVNQYRKRKERKEADRERERRRYEEPHSPENYYARDYQDDNYSPSPPHASGGSYHPHSNAFPPPPQPQPSFTQHTTTSTTHVNHEANPTYNPADYANQPPNPDPYGYPPQPRTGDNVSANEHTSHQAFVPPPVPTGVSGAPPYFPPPPVAPFPEEQFTRDPFERAEEGGVNHHAPRSPSPASTVSPLSTPPHSPNPSHPTNKSVNFAPLSPTSSRRLTHIHDTAAATNSNTHNHSVSHPDVSPSNSDSDIRGSSALVPALVRTSQPRSTSRDRDRKEETDHVYDSSRRSRRRRYSDTTSDRPIQPSKHRRRHKTHSRSPSPTSSDEIEVLPDRFDRDGRPLDRYGNAYRNPRASGRDRGLGGGDFMSGALGGLLSGKHGEGKQEMVEKLATEFGDVIEGRKTWKDLLRGFVEEAGNLSNSERGSSSRRRRERDH